MCGEPFELESITNEIRSEQKPDSTDDEVFDIGDDDETFEIEDDDSEIFEIEDDEAAQEPGDTFVSTQDTDHQDDLYLPKVPIASNEDTESVDSTPFAVTEGETMDGTDEDSDDDEFEISEEVAAVAKTEAGTEMVNRIRNGNGKPGN